MKSIGADMTLSPKDVPTFAEAGITGYDATFWYGLLAPARTPTAIIDKLNAEFAKAVDAPKTREIFAANAAATASAASHAHSRRAYTHTCLQEEGTEAYEAQGEAGR